MKVTRKSRMTGKVHTREIDVSLDELIKIDNPKRRELIQNIVPHLTASEREFLMTGITDEEWAGIGWGEE